MKKVTMCIKLTLEDAEVVLGKLRSLASSHILNGEDEEAACLVDEIRYHEKELRKGEEDESITV